MTAMDWIRRFRDLTNCCLTDAKAAYDQRNGMSPETKWKSFGGRVPLSSSVSHEEAEFLELLKSTKASGFGVEKSYYDVLKTIMDQKNDMVGDTFDLLLQDMIQEGIIIKET
jgi:hypothetical protein